MQYRIQPLFFLLWVSTSLVACSEPTPDTTTPNKFDQYGIQFDYPGNWIVEESSSDVDGTRGVDLVSQLAVGGEGDASMMVNVFDDETDLPLFIEMVGTSLVGELDELTTVGDTTLAQSTVSPTRTFKSSVGGKPTQGIVLPYAVTIFGEKVSMIMEFHELKTENGHAIISAIAPDEELKKIRPGFQLVYDTIKVTAPRKSTR